MADILRIADASTLPGTVTEEKIMMKAVAVTNRAAGLAGMKLVTRARPQAAINDVIVRVHASGFVSTELELALDVDRSPRP